MSKIQTEAKRLVQNLTVAGRPLFQAHSQAVYEAQGWLATHLNPWVEAMRADGWQAVRFRALKAGFGKPDVLAALNVYETMECQQLRASEWVMETPSVSSELLSHIDAFHGSPLLSDHLADYSALRRELEPAKGDLQQCILNDRHDYRMQQGIKAVTLLEPLLDQYEKGGLSGYGQIKVGKALLKILTYAHQHSACIPKQQVQISEMLGRLANHLLQAMTPRLAEWEAIDKGYGHVQ